MPRFVVLEHTGGEGSHFDLMLEHEGVLVTFSFPEFPAPPMTGERLFDHRLGYLEYEGDIGGDRGTVRRVESGDFDLLAKGADSIRVQLRASRLTGAFKLTKTRGGAWTFTVEDSLE